MTPRLEGYTEDINFSELARQDPDLAVCLKPNGQLDFSDPRSVKQLTESILRHDFALDLDLPDDRLCPPVPIRFNYVRWIQSLLDSTDPSFQGGSDADRPVLGLDIGTGASAIYPLLACTTRPAWRMHATDIDAYSFEYAARNVEANELSSRIKLHLVARDSPLIRVADGEDGDDRGDGPGLDFTMCNPPFYESEAELLAGAAAKSRPPRSACTGAAVEMVTEGGEVAFVGRMVDESAVLRGRVGWYTSMLGKLGSLEPLVERLKGRGCTNWAVSELATGGKTKRWVLGWSWWSMRPETHVARGVPGLPKHLLPFPSEAKLTIGGRTKQVMGSRILNTLKELDADTSFLPGTEICLFRSTGDVWSRAARRAKARGADGVVSGQGEGASDTRAFAVKIKLSEDRTEAKNLPETDVLVQWAQGFESVVFESFVGMLRRQMTV